MAFNSSSVIGMVDSFYIMQDLTDIRGIRNFLIIGIAHVFFTVSKCIGRGQVQNHPKLIVTTEEFYRIIL